MLTRLSHAAPRPQAYVRQFGPAEGLAQPFIYCLLQDRQGYLWLGTAEGLVRYDGTRFVTLTTHDGLADNFVTGLWQDPASGALWASHAQGGRSVRLTPNQPFRPAPASQQNGPPPGGRGAPAPDTARLGAYLRRYHLALPADVVPTCLLEDREGHAWLGTAGQGLWLHADRYLSLWPKPGGPLGNELARIVRPASQGGGCWMATAAGVYEVPGPSQPAQLVPGLPRSLGSAVTALAYAPGSGLWVGTAADGVYLLPDKTAASPAPATQHFTTATGLLHNSIAALLADHTGRVWVGAHNTGLATWEPTQHRFSYLKLNTVGLDATTLAEDAAGTIWVGTEGQGLYFRPASGRWQHLGKATGTLPDDFLTAVLPLPAPLAGALLLVHPQGLSLLDAHRVATPLTSPDDQLARGTLPVVALAPGVAWVATRSGQLRLDLAALARLRPGQLPAPSLVSTGAEVDGESRPGALGTLPAGRHRVSFAFQGVSLGPGGAAGLQYRYRLRGLADDWSHPSPVGEAQFAGLGAGRYLLEAQVRRAAPGAPWSAVATRAFAIATPWWRTPLALVLELLALAAALVAVVRTREGVLRRQKLQLENTVRERTSELRQKNHDIEHINAELLVARDAAEASRRAKAQFLANMSHEIRTPMNAVIGLTNLLQQTPTTTEQSEYLTAIGSSSQNLLVILNDILDSSKMEAGKLTLEQVAFRLPEAVRGLSTLFRYAADSKGLSLRVTVADAVPEAVVGDPVRLQQVLVNLVSNALKFTRQGGVAVRVGLAPGPAAEPGHVALRFEVQDTGIGIPSDKLAAIFEDFSQANTSTTREFGGTGLGLSIARNLVQLHGGQLGVSSEEGAGSQFYFELTYPVAEASQARLTAVAGPLPPFEPALRVLVAEDNQLNQLVARKTLENWNVHVVIAENGRLAVERVLTAAEPFDAVFMDIQMPELDGYAAARTLRQHCPDAARLPIIGLTASVLPEDRSLALAAGMNDILAKPFEPAALYARLAHFTGRLAAAASSGEANLPSAPPPSAPPALHPSWQQLEELSGGNASFISQIVNTFLTEAPALEQVLAAAYPHDLPAVAATAHKLKGQVAYFGVPGLHAQLDELERSARLPGCPYCEPLLQTVQQQLGQLYPHLEARA
ncbi:response regulator [Hymenobacter sp. BRD128]|uniref:hybrid sensor histidine kinase/response regulator n=1 Tax=Hymenobacter sp. BRD128 TaxID=2675878 RepID=UPI00156472A8|nr:hybrid sensor histidine kinase/response regulator [Hymenobacter sp. BRD128]QKG57624.1 response regulator [Hymenobacter sp. BRD128]